MTPDIDLEHLAKLGGLDDPGLVAIITDFLASLGDRVGELERLREQGDPAGFREAAHRLKGAAAMSGFPAIADLASAFETSADPAGGLPDPAPLMPAAQRAREAFASARSS